MAPDPSTVKSRAAKVPGTGAPAAVRGRPPAATDVKIADSPNAATGVPPDATPPGVVIPPPPRNIRVRVTGMLRWLRRPRVCQCGHDREDHRHYRRGSECSLCDCAR